MIAAINTRKELKEERGFVGGAPGAVKEAAVWTRRTHFPAGQLQCSVVVY